MDSKNLFYRVISKLASYRAPDQLKKEVFNILMNNIESNLIQQWNNHFEGLDTDNTGMIKIKELIKLIGSTGRFKSQLKQLKELNKKDPNLKIKYSDFLLRIVDIKKEVKAEDIANAFKHLDTDGSGKIDAKDLQSFLRRRGEDITEEEASAMIRKAETKVSSLSMELRDKKTTYGSDDKFDTNVPQEIDYPMFKKYLLSTSPESHTHSFLKSQSSMRFSEYNGASTTSFGEPETARPLAEKSKFSGLKSFNSGACTRFHGAQSECKSKFMIYYHFGFLNLPITSPG